MAMKHRLLDDLTSYINRLGKVEDIELKSQSVDQKACCSIVHGSLSLA